MLNEKRFKIETITHYEEEMSFLEKKKVLSALSFAAFVGAALIQFANSTLPIPDIVRLCCMLSALGFTTASVLQFKILSIIKNQKKMLLEIIEDCKMDLEKNKSKVLER